GNARKEFEKGMDAVRKQDSASAIGHLAKATELDPQFFEALTSLGVQHLQADANETAIEYFQKAAAIDSRAVEPQVNIALAFLRRGRNPEAEAVARRILQNGIDDCRAHYLLGLALWSQQKNDSEALDNLQRASQGVPHERLAIAKIAEHQGDTQRARQE